MIETLFDFIELDSKITVDPRAHLRERSTPTLTDVRCIESYGDALRVAGQLNRSPAVIIKENGDALIYGCGGSGLILVCCKGVESDEQSVMIERFMAALGRLGATEQMVRPFPYVE